MKILDLPSVTLAIVDDVNHELARMAVDECMAKANFGDVLILSDKNFGPDSARFHEIPKSKSLNEAIRHYWYTIPELVNTSHVLYIQWDSWIINPEMWTDEFLEYDYIGAPWWYKDEMNVGNGGFSLRSTKLMRHLQADPIRYRFSTLEDDHLCRALRPALEKQDFRWAPEELAYRFSRETQGWDRADKSFGFHGVFTWPLFMTPVQIGERAKHFNEYITNGGGYRQLLANQARVASAMEDRHEKVKALVEQMMAFQAEREVAKAADVAQKITQIDAVMDFERAARTEALAALANNQYALGHLGTAVDFYYEATRICPNFSNLYRAIALIWKDIGWFSRAQKEAKIAVAVEPGNILAQLTLALLSVEVADEKTARAALDAAFKIDPNNTTAVLALASLEADKANYAEAIRICEELLATNPEEAVRSDINHTIGAAYLRQGRPDEALGYILRPEGANHPPQIWNRGIAYLMKGNYADGWRDYEARFQMVTGKNTGGRFGCPLWDGRPGNKRLHLHFEQGFGDTIQMARFLPLVQAMGHRLSVEVQPELLTLFRDSFPTLNIGRSAYDYPGISGIPWDFECHAPMMSLPHLLGVTLENLSDAPYLKADPARVREWARTIGDTDKKKVGFCWAGQSMIDGSLFMRTIDQWRSMTRKQIQPLIETPGIEAYSLQYGYPFPNAEHEFEDFADTAALIENLDLVITVDTAVAHLAGALGKPTWILNRRDSCWRWLLDRDDSPWYSGVRLYRQSQRGGWNDVIARVTTDLKVFVLGK